jgi:hypothetical protein
LFSHWFEKNEIKKLMQEAGFKNIRIVEEGIGFIVVCQK